VVVPFDYYVWVGTDPVTQVGASPLAEIPSLVDLPRVVRLKYLAAANRWTHLAPDRVESLHGAAASSDAWRAMLADYGVVDVASAVLRDRFGTWGFVDLWRCTATGPPFTVDEIDFLASLLPELTNATRAKVKATFVPAEVTSGGPVVLTMSDQLVPQGQTPQTDEQLRALLPTRADLSPVPAVAINVAAQVLAIEAGVDNRPATTRLAYGPGQWITARAGRLQPPTTSSRATIAVTIARATTIERVGVYERALGLSARESELFALLITGADTRHIARSLTITEHTVNDHLKSVFAKAGVQSRRQLLANATG
jgi:DNA-binding CsgD family transcriptional regulator